MPENDDFNEYQKAISDWASPSDIRRITGWITSEKVILILEELRSPADVLEAIRAIKAQERSRERWSAFRAITRDFGKWLLIIFGGFATIQAGWVVLSQGWRVALAALGAGQ
ncbi:hypothetical protein [Amaricoccus solimangrovi]|uniref:Uncharacterized protein n=1 Tax=Amaricoccus solimangrovi TaxID=2589815 RepID=A0A501W2J0_9RHOB|nr:hypothetical protein [Amaricoccus solimangrovi]TPE44143.1 hypothetical protein FJM51_23120 [Amaricoccus solimangrovi]